MAQWVHFEQSERSPQRPHAPPDARRLARHAETARRRLLGRCLARAWRGWLDHWVRLKAEAELRALDERELGDLGLDRGGIAHAARHGRDGSGHLA